MLRHLSLLAYMPRTEKKDHAVKKRNKQTNSGLKIGSRPVASSDLKLTRAMKSRGSNA